MLDVLGDVIQPSKQAEWISQGSKCACSKAGGYTKPGLLSQFHDNALFERLNGHGHGGLPAGHGIGAAAHLNHDPVALTEHLCPQIASIELAQQDLRDIHRFDFSMKDFSFHEVDYNRLCDSPYE